MNRSLLHRVGIFARLGFTYPVLALGVLMIFAVCGEVLDVKLESTPKRTAEERHSRLFSQNTIRWRPDGTCHIQQNRRQVRILDLNTKVIWKGSWDDSFLKDTYLDFSKTIHYSHSGILSPHRLKKGNNPLWLGGRSDVFFRVGQDNISRLETWLLAPSLDRLHRYDAKGRYSGSLGANGFVPEKRQAQSLGTFRMCIRLDNGYSMLWVTDRQIYAIDLQAQTVVPQLPDNRTLSLVERSHAGKVHAMTDDGRHYVFKRDGELSLALRIHDKNGNDLAGSLAFSGKEKELYLYRRSGPERSAGQVCEEVLYRVAKDGLAEEVNRVEWTYLPGPPTDLFILDVINPAWLGGLPIYEGRHWPLLAGRDRSGMAGMLEPIEALSGKSLVGWVAFTVLLLAIGIAVKGLRGWSTAGWALFVFLFGLPALLCWLAIAPRRSVRCSACGKRVESCTATCRHCRQTIPPEQTLLISNPVEVSQ